jgi:hypothetical protein
MCPSVMAPFLSRNIPLDSSTRASIDDYDLTESLSVPVFGSGVVCSTDLRELANASSKIGRVVARLRYALGTRHYALRMCSQTLIVPDLTCACSLPRT